MPLHLLFSLSSSNPKKTNHNFFLFLQANAPAAILSIIPNLNNPPVPTTSKLQLSTKTCLSLTYFQLQSFFWCCWSRCLSPAFCTNAATPEKWNWATKKRGNLSGQREFRWFSRMNSKRSRKFWQSRRWFWRMRSRHCCLNTTEWVKTVSFSGYLMKCLIDWLIEFAGDDDNMDQCNYIPPQPLMMGSRESRGKSPVTPSYRRPPPYVSP